MARIRTKRGNRGAGQDRDYGEDGVQLRGNLGLVFVLSIRFPLSLVDDRNDGRIKPQCDSPSDATYCRGLLFSAVGQYKVFGTDFTMHGGFEQWIRSFIMQGAYPWMKPILGEIILPHAQICAFLTAYGELMIGLGLVAGVLTRVASVFGIALMSLLWLSAGYPGPHSALWPYFGASLDWSVFVACFVAFLVGEPEARWSLTSRLLGKAKYLGNKGFRN